MPVRRSMAWAASLIVLGGFAPVRAQSAPGAKAGAEGGDRPRPVIAPGALPTTPLLLIQRAPVQKELKLTEEQKARIARLDEQLNQQRRDEASRISQGARGVSSMGAVQEMIAARRTKDEAELARLLEPGQRGRLQQIALQIEGPMAVARPEVAEKLNMSPEQREVIAAKIAEYNAARQALWQSQLDRLEHAPRAVRPPKAPDKPAKTAAVSPEEKEKARAKDKDALAARLRSMSEESARLHEEAVRQIGKEMTRRQKDAFNRMLGEPFDLTSLLPGAPRRIEEGGGGAPMLEPVAPPRGVDEARSATRSPQPRHE
jgi:hypothetical protein